MRVASTLTTSIKKQPRAVKDTMAHRKPNLVNKRQVHDASKMATSSTDPVNCELGNPFWGIRNLGKLGCQKPGRMTNETGES